MGRTKATKAIKSTHGGARPKAGRKPLLDGVASVLVALRMTPPQRDKLRRLGGGTWVRKKIDKARDPEPDE